MAVSETIMIPIACSGIETCAQNAIREIDWGPQAGGRRSALGWYNSTLITLLGRWKSAHEAVGSLKYDESRSATTLDIYDGLLDAAAEHLECCSAIAYELGGLGESTNGTRLKRAFDKQLSWYGSRVKTAVNRMKHNGAGLRHFAIHKDGVAVHGYYVECAINAETLGPDPTVHEGGDTAFSFNKDLRMHALGVLACAREIEALSRSSLGMARRDWRATQSDGGLLECLRIACDLPLFVFPDEAIAAWPMLERNAVGDAEQFTAVFPTNARLLRQPPRSFRRSEMKAFTGGDGYNRAFGLPYLGTNFWKRLSLRNPRSDNLI